ncbi:MAG: hypothetical protein GQ569_12730 [Methylococcaceae bacterium]|nr:hypothetical protein [Methylococcaceae bacterium]
MELTLAENQPTGEGYYRNVQANLTAALVMTKQFHVLTDLNLTLNGTEYKPDISLYMKARDEVMYLRDIENISEIPLGIVEVLSPEQTMEGVQEKFMQYFQAGVQSCWLVSPAMKTVSVYLNPIKSLVFNVGEVVEDARLDIGLMAGDIFA